MLRFARAPAIMPSRKDPEQSRAVPRFLCNELTVTVAGSFSILIPMPISKPCA